MKNCVLVLLLMSLATLAQAAEQALSQQVAGCQQIADATERLVCFDALSTVPKIIEANTTEAAIVQTPAVNVETECEPPKIEHRQGTYLDRKWHLSKECDDDTFLTLEPHYQNYIVASMSSNANDVADTPSQDPTDARSLQNKDLQFQLSLKTQLYSDIPLVRGLPWVETSRLWAAYTQRSYWQVFDGSKSEPFRETNFAPELILSLGLSDERPRWVPKMLNLGALHESNGREDPYSRSWNRIYLAAGWQLSDNYSVVARPWWIPKSDASDNPDIEKFMGYGDLTLRWHSTERDQWATLLLRNNLRSDNKGYAKFNYNYALSERISWYFMMSAGYGESLLDYNHHQNTIGLGFAVGD